MKKVSMKLLTMSLLFIFACGGFVNIEEEEAKVKEVVDLWVHSYEREDIAKLFKILAHDNDMVLFGTDADERWVGWEDYQKAIRHQYKSIENMTTKVTNEVIKVSKSGTVAWVSLNLEWNGTTLGEAFSIKGVRMTGVLEKRDNKWIFVQFHNSLPFEGQVVKYEK